MEHILLIDTSAEKCTVGLVRDGQLLQALQHADKQSQAAVLNVMVAQLCEATSVPLATINAFAVCSGPGSYTGLRIGLAAAKGYAFALEKPLILHDKLTLLAHQQILADNNYWQYAAIITAREGEYFYASFDAEMNILQHAVHGNVETISALINELSPSALCILGDERAQQAFGERVIVNAEIDFAAWAPLVAKSFALAEFSDNASAVPFYMKEVFIQASKK